MPSIDGPFLCPECGSTTAGVESLVSPSSPPRTAWDQVLDRIECAACHLEIPRHLSAPTPDAPADALRAEWRAIYRAGAMGARREVQRRR